MEINDRQVSPVSPIIFSSDDPTERIQEITARLEEGVASIFESEQYTAYLRAMSKFHNYSFRNTILILMQGGELVKGYNQWLKEFGRHVKPGEKGIKILAPAPYKVKNEMERIDPQTQRPVLGPDGKPVMDEVEITIPAFKVATVFDVSQTEGKELPDIAVDALTGDVEQYKDFLSALEKASPAPIGFEQIESGANGYYHHEEKRIAIQEGMSELQTIKTTIHEIAHAKLHAIDKNAPKEEQRPKIDRRTREVQAESVAYAVCQHYGLDTSDYSFGYVAGWSSGKEVAELKASLETIRTAAIDLIAEIDGRLSELQKQRETVTPELNNTFSIYQLKGGDTTRFYRFEPLDRLEVAGLAVDRGNYELIYTAPLSDTDTLEDIYRRFNTDHPEDFTGHSLSVSDVVVLNNGGKLTAHYCDSFGFREVPQFLQERQRDSLTLEQAALEPQPGYEEWSEPATADNAPDNPDIPSDDINAYLPKEVEQAAQQEPTESAPMIKYYPIDEQAARRAKEANSFSDYSPGSATAEYRRSVDEAVRIAEQQKSCVDPMYHERIDRLLDTYARKLAENTNNRNSIDARVPSVLIAGPSNFPVRKKEKQNAARDKNMEEWQSIQGLLDKIRGTGMGGISADDPNALQKLHSKLEGLEQSQETMKAVNAYFRKNKTLDGCTILPAEQSAQLKAVMSRSWRSDPKPFEAWALSNNNAEIHRVRERIEELTRRSKTSSFCWSFDGGKVEANTQDNRLQIFFDGKPDEATRAELKENGFRWAPSVGAWQRQLTNNALYATKRMKCTQPNQTIVLSARVPHRDGYTR